MRRASASTCPGLVRSAAYGGLATILAFLLGYPLAYTIAFKGGRFKNLLLFLVIAPFFTSFLLRTISWKTILTTTASFRPDQGSRAARRGLPGPVDARRVIAGITYNLLPFMTLPLYVAIEKVDFRLLEAAKDLYAGPWRPGGTIVGGIVGGVLVGSLGSSSGWIHSSRHRRGGIGAVIGSFLITEAFVRVTFPLSLPGVFAGSLLTFIPAVGDFVNAELLGDPRTQMIGNVIQARFLRDHGLPDGVGPVVHPHGRDHRRRPRVRPDPRDRGADRGPGMTAARRDRDRQAAGSTRRPRPVSGGPGPLAPADLHPRSSSRT